MRRLAFPEGIFCCRNSKFMNQSLCYDYEGNWAPFDISTVLSHPQTNLIPVHMAKRAHSRISHRSLLPCDRRCNRSSFVNLFNRINPVAAYECKFKSTPIEKKIISFSFTSILSSWVAPRFTVTKSDRAPAPSRSRTGFTHSFNAGDMQPPYGKRPSFPRLHTSRNPSRVITDMQTAKADACSDFGCVKFKMDSFFNVCSLRPIRC